MLELLTRHAGQDTGYTVAIQDLASGPTMKANVIMLRTRPQTHGMNDMHNMQLFGNLSVATTQDMKWCPARYRIARFAGSTFQKWVTDQKLPAAA